MKDYFQMRWSPELVDSLSILDARCRIAGFLKIESL